MRCKFKKKKLEPHNINHFFGMKLQKVMTHILKDQNKKGKRR
jgi:hypothetical protein